MQWWSDADSDHWPSRQTSRTWPCQEGLQQLARLVDDVCVRERGCVYCICYLISAKAERRHRYWGRLGILWWLVPVLCDSDSPAIHSADNNQIQVQWNFRFRLTQLHPTNSSSSCVALTGSLSCATSSSSQNDGFGIGPSTCILDATSPCQEAWAGNQVYDSDYVYAVYIYIIYESYKKNIIYDIWYNDTATAAGTWYIIIVNSQLLPLYITLHHYSPLHNCKLQTSPIVEPLLLMPFMIADWHHCNYCCVRVIVIDHWSQSRNLQDALDWQSLLQCLHFVGRWSSCQPSFQEVWGKPGKPVLLQMASLSTIIIPSHKAVPDFWIPLTE